MLDYRLFEIPRGRELGRSASHRGKLEGLHGLATVAARDTIWSLPMHKTRLPPPPFRSEARPDLNRNVSTTASYPSSNERNKKRKVEGKRIEGGEATRCVDNSKRKKEEGGGGGEGDAVVKLDDK